MPARIVLPSALLWSCKSGQDASGPPLDLEAELRRAVVDALASCEGGSEALEDDAVEALACTACEVIGDGPGEGLRESLESTIAEVGLEDEALREAVLAALLAVAERDAGAGNAPLLLPAAKLPAVCGKSAGVDKPKWQRRGDAERDRATEYLLERNVQMLREEEERQAHERELSAYYGGAAPESAESSSLAARGSGVATIAGGASVASAAVTAAGGAAEDSDSESSEEEDEVVKRDREINKRRLRELGEPVTLFGETDDARAARLRRHELTHDQDELAGGSTNVMQILDRRADREAPAALRREHYAGASLTAVPLALANADDDMLGDGGDAEPIVPSEAEDAEAEPPEDEDVVSDDTKVMLRWLRTTLREWEANLQVRSKDEHRTAAFKTEKAQFRQSKQYLKPLRRALRDDECAPSLVCSLAAIATLCEKRDYKGAKEAYMRLAIGNSPWPMGVTMATFHDRANRHKIGEGANAHVLDDETTRKYVQMVKRLCTFCETRWPIDPSLAA